MPNSPTDNTESITTPPTRVPGGSAYSRPGIAAAAKLADVVIFAVNYPQAGEAVREAGGFAGKVLVDISNPITEDYKDLRIGHTTSAAEELQKLAWYSDDAKEFRAAREEKREPNFRGR